MTARASPSVVRFRSSCPDRAAYEERHAADHARNGVFIPTRRPDARPIGSRVLLKIELADGSLGYSGGAIVAKHVPGGARPGYLLRFEEVEIAVEPVPPPARTPAPGAVLGRVALTPAPASAPAPAATAPAGPAAPPADGAAASAPEVREPEVLPDAPKPAARPNLLDVLFGDDAPGARAEPASAPTAPAAALPEPARDPFGVPVAPPSDPFAPPAAATADPFARAVAAARPADRLVPQPAGSDRGPAPAPDTAPPSAAPGAAPDGGAPGAAPPAPEESVAGALPLPPLSLRAHLARHRAAVAAAVVLAVAAVAAQQVAQRRAGVAEAAFAAAIARADDRLRSGRVAAPAGDSALDHLEVARRLLPEDGRLTARGALLADALEDLGRRALARGDLEEAAAHFRGALRADPARASARSALETIARIEPGRARKPR